jgi:hypothetical protein
MAVRALPELRGAGGLGMISVMGAALIWNKD